MPCDYYNPYDMDNEDCHYYYGYCKSIAQRKYDSEIKYINKKIFKYFTDYTDWQCIKCIGVFSNGEAIYKEVKKC